MYGHQNEGNMGILTLNGVHEILLNTRNTYNI